MRSKPIANLPVEKTTFSSESDGIDFNFTDDESPLPNIHDAWKKLLSTDGVRLMQFHDFRENFKKFLVIKKSQIRLIFFSLYFIEGVHS